MIETGVYFDDIHSFYDLNLILAPFMMPPALPKTSYIDIPGGDGSLDLTEAHGEVKYYDRDCKFTFTMNPSDDLSETAFEEKKTEVSNLLNGKRCKITLDKDSEFYYIGRCIVEEYLSDKRIRQIVVSARVSPYKYRQAETVVTFDITDTETEYIIINSRKPVSPSITCTDDDTTISFGSKTVTVSAGTYEFLDLRLTHGVNKVYMSGSGQVTFKYQEGEL
jgi:hypothetical protein